ncbi:glycosyltransferase family 4 protein [Flavobacterium ponti]|uniref:Glycosyltransferase family 4 protein n=1 Tax=Flavobacterium ponti TaxID=665133 RepID=A0ABV9P1T6_9FLAO
MNAQKIKILQVIDTLNIGGGERVFVDMCNILKENKEDFEVFYLLESGKLHKELDTEIIFYELKRKGKWNFSKMHQASLLLKKYDIIHCHFRHVYRYIALVCFIFRIKSKIILHDHYGSIDVNKKIPFLFNTFLKPKLYIGVSKSLSDWAINCLKVNNKNVFTLQNIILRSDIIEKLEDQTDLVLVSNIKPVKNNEFAIDIIKKSNFSLSIIGKNQDQEYFNKLVTKQSDLSIEIIQNIENVQPILSNFKLGLHTSFSESGPLVLIEYLAQGLPFLAHETGEVAKTLKPYFPEYFIDNFVVEEWIDRIVKLINTPKNTTLMNTVFEKHFGKTDYYNRLKNIYYV